MTDSDYSEFSKLMLAAYKMKRLEPDVISIDMFFELVREYDFNDVRAAFMDTLKTSDFFPQPSDITKRIEGNMTKVIDFAFENSKRMVKECGFYRSIVMKDKISMLCIRDFGGLQEFLRAIMETEKEAYFSFKRMYESYIYLSKKGKLPDINKLIGYSENLAHTNKHGGTYNCLAWDNDVVSVKQLANDQALSYLEISKNATFKISEKAESVNVNTDDIKSIDDVISLIGSGNIIKL